MTAPAGAPNILVFMSDDAGFSMASTFGGPVPTPNMDRLARVGQRYNRFHTTGICSPSRAALLTGRNHHNVGTGYLVDLPQNFPGYDGDMGPDAASIAQVLRLNGYNTAMFGKHHNVPIPERSAAGPFDHWPTGLGFEYFYGFIGGAADQWHPNVYRGTSRVGEERQPPELFEKRIADDALDWIHNQKAAAPDKPFFIYYAPASVHTPLQAPEDYIERFRGKFDQGWDIQREETYRRQVAMGIVPAGTRLSPRPDGIPAWGSLTPDKKRFAARTMEVGAAMLAYQDAQFGRILDELEQMGILDNTLIVFIQGDNGAAAESGPEGAVSEMTKKSGGSEDGTVSPDVLRQLGGEFTRPAYPAGWAWAMNAPFPWVKQYASMLGGIRNGMILSWPRRAAVQASPVCAQFGHLVDIAPTVYEAAGVPAPAIVHGVKQRRVDGQSLLPSLSNCRPDAPRTQYFEIGGKIGLYHDGWFASGDDGRLSWQAEFPGDGIARTDWKLYDLRTDFAQASDLATQNPRQMKAMIALWDKEARANNVYPIIHRGPIGGGKGRPASVKPAGFTLRGANVSIPTLGNRPPIDGSFHLKARFSLNGPNSSGVIVANGSHFGGWSLFIDKGHPAFAYAASPSTDDNWRIVAHAPLAAGPAELDLTLTSEGPGKAARVEMTDGQGKAILSGTIPRTFPRPSYDENLDTGRDTGVPVTQYSAPGGVLEGKIDNVSFDFP
ncbi:arylsulfatase [Sphingobium sp. BHU LFT2]|uniref:arylsulfatase n=1 Tax=Sphingobium sp. BHU LFT2 TaxID=2807634 RepID=UPI003336BAB5